MGEDERKESGFQVKDRRRFTEQGEPRGGEAEASASPPVSGTAPDGKQAPPPSSGQEESRAPRETSNASTPLPEIDFSTFVFSLSSSVVIHLGLAPDPVSGERRRELGLAKQTIDILGMIQEKTRGNLSEEEKSLLEGILFDLRMRYVEELNRK